MNKDKNYKKLFELWNASSVFAAASMASFCILHEVGTYLCKISSYWAQ